MKTVESFLLLVARPALFWLGLLVMACLSVMLAGVSQPSAATAAYIAPSFLAILVYPGACGALVGAILTEFQHSTVAWPLPGVRGRMAVGYLATGLVATLFVVGLVATHDGMVQPLMRCTVGLGSYCLGGMLIDPLYRWLTAVNIGLALILVSRSRDAAALASARPAWAVLLSLAVMIVALGRLFGRSTWRIRPFRPTAPFPGQHWLARSESFEREKQARKVPRQTGWRATYLGRRPWRWVRAAVHETWGGTRLRSVLGGGLRATGGLWILILTYAWADRGALSFGEALGRTIYDVLFHSPHLPPLGAKEAPYAMVTLVIAALGAIVAAWTPVRLTGGWSLPLSRRQRAGLFFRCGLVDVAMLSVVLGIVLGLSGWVAGLLVGVDLRLDFVPHYVRVLLATVVLMPAAHGAGLALRRARAEGSPNTMVLLILGMVGFMAGVLVLTYVSPRILPAPWLELSVMTGLAVIAQMLHLRRLRRHFATADLLVS